MKKTAHCIHQRCSAIPVYVGGAAFKHSLGTEKRLRAMSEDRSMPLVAWLLVDDRNVVDIWSWDIASSGWKMARTAFSLFGLPPLLDFYLISHHPSRAIRLARRDSRRSDRDFISFLVSVGGSRQK